MNRERRVIFKYAARRFLFDSVILSAFARRIVRKDPGSKAAAEAFAARNPALHGEGALPPVMTSRGDRSPEALRIIEAKRIL